MRYNEEWINNYHCIINTEQRMSAKDVLSQYRSQRQSYSGQSDLPTVFGGQVKLGRSGGIRLFLYIVGILISLAAVILMAVYAADRYCLEGLSFFLGIGSAGLLACISGTISVVLKKMADLDPVKAKVLPFTGFIASGVLVIVGLACQSTDLIGWIKAAAIVFCLFIVAFFATSLVFALTERNRVYTDAVEAVCKGYVRYVYKSNMHDDRNDYRVSISPIFEFNNVRVCYDSFSPKLNSEVAMDSKVLLHLNNEDKYRVQPYLKGRVITFISLIIAFLCAAILTGVLL